MAECADDNLSDVCSFHSYHSRLGDAVLDLSYESSLFEEEFGKDSHDSVILPYQFEPEESLEEFDNSLIKIPSNQKLKKKKTKVIGCNHSRGK